MNQQLHNMSQFHLDVLREIGNIGAGNGATALSQLLGKSINMQVTRVLPMHFNEITEYVGGADNIVVTVFLNIQGDLSGNMFFIIGTDEAEALIKDMTGMTSEGDFSEMGLSVLQEVGNILSGSYLTALSDFTGLELNPTVPSLAIDMAGAVLSFGLMELGRSGDYAIMIDGELTEKSPGQSSDKEGRGVGGNFFLLPDPESFEKLFLALGVHKHGGS